MSDRPQQHEPLPPEDDLVPEDDAIIGRAFRASLVVFAVVAVAVIAVLVWLNWPETIEEIVHEKDYGEIRGLDRREDAAAMPVVRFTDITRDAGIDFVHYNGATGEKLLPETMGGGVAFFDYNNNGHADLLFVNSAPWPHDRYDDPLPTMKLYENDGAGRFDDVTIRAGLDVSFYGMGAAVGDTNNDGNIDLFITAVGPNHYFENRGGYFADETARAGLAGDAEEWSSSAGFFDMQNNGRLDLFVCNYVQWSRAIDIELNFSLNGVDRAYGPPTNYRGAHNYLYRNNGDGTFDNISERGGTHVVNPATGLQMGKALALTFMDFDDDGSLDVFVANDTVQNFLFKNNGDETFAEMGTRAGVAFTNDGSATGAMGIDAGHYRNDESIAVGIGNFSNEMTSLYVSQSRRLQFTDDAIIDGIGSPTRLPLTFGLFFFDYDLDGRLDMVQANGHIENTINEIQQSQHYRQPAQLFWNAGREAQATFVEVPRETTGDLARPIVGRGAAYADIDGDGDLDVVLTETGGRPTLLRNDQQTGHDWLRVKLIGDGETVNRDAIGARVELVAGGEAQVRYVMPTRSYLSQVETPITFGLGQMREGAAIESLRITWPNGEVTNISPQQIEVNSLLVVEQGKNSSSG